MIKEEYDEELNRITYTEYVLMYDREHRPHFSSGYGFNCDKDGTPDPMTDVQRECYAKCLRGDEGLWCRGVSVYRSHAWLCGCGSRKPRYELIDARGIFCTFVCEDCEEQKKRKYRRDIFEDCTYECDEPIEPEDYY